MATDFEIIIIHKNKEYAAQAAAAAFQLIDRLEEKLSRFLPNSEISKINSLTRLQSTTLSIETFECLQQCSQIYQDTKGAFDISAGPLIDLWKERDDEKGEPLPSQIESARKGLGLPWLELDAQTYQVKLMNDSINLDLGGFGKGYAVQAVRNLLQEWSIKSALIHSGHSTVCALGPRSWSLAIRHPDRADLILKNIELRNRASSGSGIKKTGHIIDPRSGWPVTHHLAAWAITEQAALADALSTAFIVMSAEEVEEYCNVHPGIEALILKNNVDATVICFKS